MRIKRAALAAVALLAGGVSLVAASPAAADPVVPCWSKSTYIQSGERGYFNLTYKNCGPSTITVQPYDEFYGCYGDFKTVQPGTWVSWVGLPAPAWHSDWVAGCR